MAADWHSEELSWGKNDTGLASVDPASSRRTDGHKATRTPFTSSYLGLRDDFRGKAFVQ
jgi:hypothetical protein